MRVYSSPSFLFSLHNHIFNDEWLNKISLDDLLILSDFSSKINKWSFRIDYYIKITPIKMPGNIFRTYLFKLGFSMVEINFNFTLHEVIPIFRYDPLTLICANSHAKMNQICWIKIYLPLTNCCLLGLINFKAMLRLRYL